MRISMSVPNGMKLAVACIAAALGLTLLAFAPQQAYAGDMYRMYNPNSGEHFYTADSSERNSLYLAGWDYEGIGWVAPDSGSPVYRLYNPNAGDHHYTPSAAERQSLINAGWNDEGEGWKTGGDVALYRQYNPNAVTGSHNFTTFQAENDALVRAGWQAEGVGWYGVDSGRSDTMPTSLILAREGYTDSAYSAYMEERREVQRQREEGNAWYREQQRRQLLASQYAWSLNR